MANSAAIAIIQYRLTEERRVLSEQLERALESRVMIEQAKGVLASGLQVSEDEAFRLLRQRARASRRLLTDVADEVRNGIPDADWDAYRSAGPPG
ncbi:MAG TPA: ANTAR domain-containing protein [Nocardioidaceae bacterium]|nr:ANTAR domain-containing protein [Nocardioidaceae bacterium]